MELVTDHPTALGFTLGGHPIRLLLVGIHTWVSGYVATLTNQWGNSAWDHWIGATGQFATDLGLLYLGTLGSGLAIATVILAIAAYHLQPALNTLPRFSFDGIKRWFISEDGEASVWSQSNEAEEEPDAGEETQLPFEPDEDSESILDELLDDIHQEEAEAPAAEAPLPPPAPEPEPAPAAPVTAEDPPPLRTTASPSKSSKSTKRPN